MFANDFGYGWPRLFSRRMFYIIKLEKKHMCHDNVSPPLEDNRVMPMKKLNSHLHHAQS